MQYLHDLHLYSVQDVNGRLLSIQHETTLKYAVKIHNPKFKKQHKITNKKVNKGWTLNW